MNYLNNMYRQYVGDELCGGEISNKKFIEKYPPPCIVYLINNTFQIVSGSKEYGYIIYEVDIDRTNEHWMRHLSHKVWATRDMLISLCNFAIKIGNIKHIYKDGYWENEWNDGELSEALDNIEE